MKVLETKKIYKSYTNSKKINLTPALNDLSFSIGDNEFVGIMGPSGSGKTTLLNVTSGIDKCDQGEINIWGNDISSMKKNELSLFRRKNIGMVFQDFNLLNSLTVKENIMLPLILDKKYELMEGSRLEELADMLDIEELMNRHPYEISGGQQQRVAICRAIINNPRIIFADEPTGNLDSESSKKVLTYFELVRSHFDVSVLMVTHDPFSASFCNRVVFLKDGSIINEIRKKGNKAQFFNKILEEIQNINTDNVEDSD